jgi:hypothetical protein
LRPKQVNHSPKDIANKKGPRISYFDCVKDIHGWVNASDFLPDYFDLCLIKTEAGDVLTGWHVHGGWYGRRLGRYEMVVQWKRVFGI